LRNSLHTCAYTGFCALTKRSRSKGSFTFTEPLRFPRCWRRCRLSSWKGPNKYK
jgi:hypothetical protein